MSFKTPLDIANRALQHCGVTRIRTTDWPPSEDSKNAAAVEFAYDKVRRAELRRNCWAFSTRRTAIRPVDTNTMLLNPPVWQSTTTYGVGQIVADSDSLLWVSSVPNNSNNIPNASNTWAAYFGPLTVSLFDSAQSYFAGELVYTTDNQGNFQVWMANVTGATDTPTTAEGWDATVAYRNGQVVVFVPGQSTYTPPAITAAELLTLLPFLPTTLPATSGVLWNDGGVIAVS